jgi:hypothetical protein
MSPMLIWMGRGSKVGGAKSGRIKKWEGLNVGGAKSGKVKKGGVAFLLVAFLSHVFWIAFFESRFLGRVFPVYKNVTQPALIS